jgi:NAD-dependent SIR2 family protein deacetylase
MVEAPAADVVEVVHGEWIRGMGSYTRIKCSKCEWTKPYIEDFYEAELLADMSYCPNCGARMDGDKNG